MPARLTMLTQAEEVILTRWRRVRACALEADRLLTADHPSVVHTMPALVTKCDEEIAKLEAKAIAAE